MTLINFTVTPEEANLVLGALGNVPYNAVKDLLPRLLAQAQSQIAPQPAPVAEDPVAPTEEPK